MGRNLTCRNFTGVESFIGLGIFTWAGNFTEAEILEVGIFTGLGILHG